MTETNKTCTFPLEFQTIWYQYNVVGIFVRLIFPTIAQAELVLVRMVSVASVSVSKILRLPKNALTFFLVSMLHWVAKEP